MIRSSSVALLGELADRVRLALLRVHVHLGPRHVQVAGQHDGAARRLRLPRVLVHRLEEPHLRGEVLAAVGHVDRRDVQVREAAATTMRVSKSKSGCEKAGRSGNVGLAQVQADAGVALPAVPVAPVAVHLADGLGNLLRRGLDFLQAEDVGLLARDPLGDLRVPRANAVHVPGGNLQHGSGRIDRSDWYPVSRTLAMDWSCILCSNGWSAQHGNRGEEYGVRGPERSCRHRQSPLRDARPASAPASQDRQSDADEKRGRPAGAATRRRCRPQSR